MKLKKIYFSHLRNEAHYEFLVLFQKLLDSYPGVKNLLGELYPDFEHLLALEMHLVDAARGSQLTAKIVEADRRIDRDISGIRGVIKSTEAHFDPAMAKAARILHGRLKDFGNIRAKAYEEESAAVQLLVDDFHTTFAPQVQAVGLAPWVEELAAAEAEFTALFEQRNAEIASRPQKNFIQMRREIEALYRNMTVCILSDLALHGETRCGEFVRELNNEIKYFNEHIHHRTQHNIADATIRSIPDQDCTGRQIILLPDVRFENRQLDFASDFIVSYRDNIVPGNARLTVHGRGKFKGRKTVTFSIVGTLPDHPDEH